MPSFSGSGERPTDTPPPHEEEGHRRFLPKTSRRTLGIALAVIAIAVVFLAVSAWIASGRAQTYPGVTALADDLTLHGFSCDIEAATVFARPQERVSGSESGQCLIDGEQTFLAVYRDLTETPQELEGGFGGLVMAVGPNWIVVSPDAATARSISDALGGDVIEEGGNFPGS